MFLTPYDTTLTKSVVLTKTLQQLQLAKAEGRLVQAVERIPNIFAVVGKGPGVDSIPAFAHALVDETTIYIDLRVYGSAVYYQNEYTKPTDGIPATLVKQALLQTVWQSSETNRRELYHLSPLPQAVFASWISELVTRRLALDDFTQMKLAALAAWFFTCLFKTESELEGERLTTAAVKINRITHVPLEICQQVVDLGYLVDSAAFVEAAKQLGSLKLESFNQGFLYNTISGSWFGPKETIAVAFEHPPTFIAVLHTVVNERGFQKTSIGQSAQRHLKGNVLQQFNQSFTSVIRRLED